MDITAPKAQCERIAEEIYSKRFVFENACDPFANSNNEDYAHLCRKEWESMVSAYKEAETQMSDKYPNETRYRTFDAYDPSNWVKFLNTMKE